MAAALEVSIRMSAKANRPSSNRVISRVPRASMDREIVITARARWVVSRARRRPERFTSSSLRTTLSTSRATAATVVVLRPPPVEAGDAPTSISRQLSSLDPSRIAPRSTELKPAVRMVTDWKKALSSF